MTKSVSVVTPTFNESANIGQLINAIYSELKDCAVQVIVVDDNSTDETRNIVKSLESEFPTLKLIHRTTDRGLANSIKAGLLMASGESIVIMDSDFNHKPEYLKMMVANLAYYDVVVASRFQYGGSMDSRFHYNLSWIFNILCRLITGGFITDSLYGYLAIRREAYQSLQLNEIFWGYGDYCIRLMFYLQQQKRRILQFPAVNGRRLGGQSKTKFLKVFFQYLSSVIVLMYRERICSESKKDRKM